MRTIFFVKFLIYIGNNSVAGNRVLWYETAHSARSPVIGKKQREAFLNKKIKNLRETIALIALVLAIGSGAYSLYIVYKVFFGKKEEDTNPDN